jgi:hypothetical protein
MRGAVRRCLKDVVFSDFCLKKIKEICAFYSFVNFVVNLRIDKRAIQGE